MHKYRWIFAFFHRFFSLNSKKPLNWILCHSQNIWPYKFNSNCNWHDFSTRNLFQPYSFFCTSHAASAIKFICTISTINVWIRAQKQTQQQIKWKTFSFYRFNSSFNNFFFRVKSLFLYRETSSTEASFIFLRKIKAKNGKFLFSCVKKNLIWCSTRNEDGEFFLMIYTRKQSFITIYSIMNKFYIGVIERWIFVLTKRTRDVPWRQSKSFRLNWDGFFLWAGKKLYLLSFREELITIEQKFKGFCFGNFDQDDPVFTVLWADMEKNNKELFGQ